MGQISYGTITITDTNDIARIYVVYAKHTSNSDATGLPAASSWSESIATAPGNGNYIWQRTVTEQSGTHDLTYGNPVCVTGPQGGTGATGRGVSSIVTTYCNYGTGTPEASYAGWQNTVPTYDNEKPNYWVKTVITYTTGSPATDTSIYKDNGITDAIYNSAVANSIAQSANENSQGALSQAEEALQTAIQVDTLLGGHFMHGGTLSQATPASARVIEQIEESGVDVSTNPNKWHHNVTIGSNGIQLRYNEAVMAQLAANQNGSTDTALKFYQPPTVSGNTTTQGALTMELSGNALKFYNPITGTAQMTIGANGILQSGNYNYRSDLAEKRFSVSGTQIDLTNGDIITPNFRLASGQLHSISAGAYIKGTIEALSGYIQAMYIGTNATNRWEIGNFTNYDQSSSAALISNGTAFIQLGKLDTWRLSTDRIHTAWIADNSTALTFPVYDDKRWDWGMHSPHKKNNTWRDKFLYIRNADTEISASSLAQDLDDDMGLWTYQFWIDREGKVHAPGFYIGDSTTPIGGGAGTVAERLTQGYGSATQPVYFNNSGVPTNTTYTLNAAGAKGVDTSIGTASTSTNLPTSQAVASFVEGKGYITSYVNITYSLTQDSSDGHKITLTPSSGTAQTITIPDNNTTYTFTNGTNGFTVTPSGGSAQTVTVTPSISNNVTGSGTNGYLVKWNGTNTVTNGPALGTDTTKFLNNKGEWTVPGGTYSLGIATYTVLGGVKPWYSTTGTSSLANSGTAATYTDNVSVNQRSTTAGKYYPIEIDTNGRMFVNVPWTNVNSNYLTGITSSMVTTALGYTPYNSTNPNGYTTNTGTVTSVKVQGSNGLTGSGTVTTSGTITISHAAGTGTSSSNSGRTYIQSVTLDDYGHVTGLTTGTETVTDTHHTAYFYDTTSTGTSRVTTNTTDPYLTLVENGSARSRVQLKAGTNITSITANNGVITFVAKDTTYTAATAAPGKVASASSQGTSTNYARQDHTHGIDLATGDANGQVKIAGTNVSVKGLGSWAYKSSGTASDVGLGNVTNYSQITKIGESGDGKLRVWTGDPDGTGYTDVEVHITAYDQSTVSKAEALNLSAKVGDTNKPVYFKADGKPYAISYEINKSVPSDAVFTDHTYEFADSYNASTNKGATVATVTNAINNLDVTAITGTAGQTITSISETNGKISATYSNISITKSQISDFPSSMTPAAHNHSQIVTVGDQRSTTTTPNSYANALIFQGLKNKATVGSPSNDTYSYIVGLRGWSDSSGGDSHELAFNNTGLYWRHGATTTWGDWYRIYTTGNKPTASDVGLGNVENKSSATIRGELTSSNVTTALGYTPYNSTNPNGYTSNAGTVTSITPGNGLINGTSGTSQTAITGSGTISMASITRTNNTSTASPAHGGTFTAIDSITTDSYGRVTAVNTKTVTLPADNNTDTKVTQAYSTTNNSYPLLMTATAGITSTNSRGDTTAILTNGIYANPSNGTITATTFSGNATSATAFNSGTTVKLTGNVTGESSSSTKGWAVSTTIGSGVVTNDMLAGSITNSKLSNSSITINSTAVSLGGSINVGTVTKVTAGTGLKIGSTSSGGDITTSGTINHINSVTAKTAAAQSAKTLTWGGTFTLYEEKYDTEGHITGVASYNMTMPSNPNSDTKVKLTSQSTNGIYPLIFGPTSISSGSAYEAYYNTSITVNPADGIIKSPKAVFDELIATDANITQLTAENATVVGLLDVQGQLHSNSWTNSNIATIDGSFYITPTVSVKEGTFTYTSASNGTITLNAKEGYSFGVDNNFWKQNSLVMITGQVAGSDAMMPLGTIRGKLYSATTSTIVIVGPFSDAEGGTCSTLTEIGYTSTAKDGENLKVSLYQTYANSGLNPIGIYMSSGGYVSANVQGQNNSFIDIYGGGEKTTTAPANTGAFAKPVLRIGNLANLGTTGGQTITGYGIYTTNGYFEGVITSTKGYIGGFTIGSTSLYNGSTGINNTTGGVYLGYTKNGDTVSAAGLNVSGGSATTTITFSSSNFTKTINGTSRNNLRAAVGSNFGMDENGNIYANGANIANINAGNISAGNIDAARMQTNLITAMDAVVDDLQAINATIGGFAIDATSIHTNGVAVTSNADNSIALSSADFTRTINSISRAGLRFAIGDKFGVTGDGAIYASNADVTGSILATSFTAKDSNNKTRATVDTNGLKVYDTDGTTEVAQFGSTLRLGIEATNKYNILVTTNGIQNRKNTSILSQFDSSSIKFYDGSGTASSNILAEFGSSATVIGKTTDTNGNIRLVPTSGFYIRQGSKNIISTYYIDQSTKTKYKYLYWNTCADNGGTLQTQTITSTVDLISASVSSTKKINIQIYGRGYYEDSSAVINYSTSLSSATSTSISLTATLNGSSRTIATGTVAFNSTTNLVTITLTGSSTTYTGYITYVKIAYYPTNSAIPYLRLGNNTVNSYSDTDSTGTTITNYYSFVIGDSYSSSNKNMFSINNDGDVITAGQITATDGFVSENHNSPIGTIVQGKVRASLAVAHDSAKFLAKITLPAGTWLIIGTMRIPSNSTRGKAIRLNIDTAQDAGWLGIQQEIFPVQTNIRYPVVVTPTEETSYYFNAWQNTGSTITIVNVSLMAVRIC